MSYYYLYKVIGPCFIFSLCQLEWMNTGWQWLWRILRASTWMLQGYNSGTNNMNNGWKVHGEFSITRIEYVRRSNAHLHVHVCQSKVNLSYSNDSNEGYVIVELIQSFRCNLIWTQRCKLISFPDHYMLS